MAREIDFTVRTGPPMTLEVDKDGTKYEIRLGVTVLSVEDSETAAPDGMPVFGIKANLAIEVRKKS